MGWSGLGKNENGCGIGECLYKVIYRGRKGVVVFERGLD